MTTSTKAGNPAGVAHIGRHTPPQYLRRVARSIVLRAAVRGRLSWHVALPLLAKIDGGAA